MAKWRYIPGFERRKEARTAAEHQLGRRMRALTGVFWALCGILVLCFLALALAGLIEPSSDIGFTLAALIFALLWLGHAALVLYRSGPTGPAQDEEEEEG